MSESRMACKQCGATTPRATGWYSDGLGYCCSTRCAEDLRRAQTGPGGEPVRMGDAEIRAATGMAPYPPALADARVGDAVSVGIDMATGAPTGEAWVVRGSSRPQPRRHAVLARYVVPGMLWSPLAGRSIHAVPRACDPWEPIASVRRNKSHEGEPGVDIRSPGICGFSRLDGVIHVELPGLSPRWILCSCKDAGDPARCNDPEHHTAGCPVARVEGLHEGLALWPRPWRDSPWAYTPGPPGRPEHEGWRHGGGGRVRLIAARRFVLELETPGRRDLILSCFYRPPVARHEPRADQPWVRKARGLPLWNPEGWHDVDA